MFKLLFYINHILPYVYLYVYIFISSYLSIYLSVSVVVVDVQCDFLFPPLLTNIFLSSYDTSASDEADHAGHLPHSASHNYIERLTTHIEGVRRRFVRSIHSPSNSTSLMQ